MLGVSKMASRINTGREGKDKNASNADLLLHPELLSQEFMQMLLNEKKISAGDGESRDQLTDLYLRHVIPLPQRKLPNSRWGKRMERSRARQTPVDERSNGAGQDHNRKRPPVVFDGSSSHSGPVKLRKPEGSSESTGLTDRLKPPPTMNLSNPVRKLASSTPSSSSSSSSPSSSHNSVSGSGTLELKRGADSSGELHSPDAKRKIHHVTWP